MPDRETDHTTRALRAMLRGAKLGVQKAGDAVAAEAFRIHQQKSENVENVVGDQIEAKQAVLARDGASCEVGSYHDASAAIEFGSAGRGEPDAPGKKRYGPYKITPNPPREFLRWEGEDGQVHFAREVTHPGNFPKPFMRPAIDSTDIHELIGQSIRSEVAKVLPDSGD